MFVLLDFIIKPKSQQIPKSQRKVEKNNVFNTLFPFMTLIITPYDLTFFRHALNGNNFQEIMKGVICTKTNISTIIMNDNTPNDFSNKETLMIFFGTSILLGFTSFYFFSARKQRSSFINISFFMVYIYLSR